MMANPPDVLLGIITCKRPNLLSDLLDSLLSQTIFDSDIHVEIAIVDNDDRMTAAEIFRGFQDKFPCSATYLSESRRGIPFARNKILDYAVETGAKYIAFIDDDETAHPDWLLSLYSVIRDKRVDGVQGEVISLLPDGDIPRWASMAKRKTGNKAEGERRRVMSTNNVIFSTRLVRKNGLRFDERFALSGGSDVDFFSRAADLGAQQVWTNKAKVYETIPASRLTLKWQFERLFRVGATTASMSVQEKGYIFTLVKYLPRIVIRLLLGPLLFFFTGLFSRRLFLLSVHWTGSATGLVLGLFDILGNEYSTIHGN